MLKKLITIITYLLTGDKNTYFYRAVFILLFIMPVIFLAVYSYIDLYNQTTDKVYSDKQALAYLSSDIVHERLQGIVNLGISLATRPRLLESIINGRWEDAVDMFNNIIGNFLFIERIDLFDPDGDIKADIPHLPGIIGVSGADNDWYRAVKKNWVPYVSEVYLRDAKPQINVISVIIPIRKNSAKGEVIGILQIQLKPEIFKKWIKEASVGKGGFIYIVDQYGHIVYHPNLEPNENIIDLSALTIIQKLINGKKGAEINYNTVEKEKRVAAYEPVKDYNWGIIVTQPVKFAFEQRNKNLISLIITYSIIVLFSIITAVVSLILIIEIKRTEEKLRELSLIDDLTGLNNRRSFLTFARLQIKIAERIKRRLILIYVDMDNMKMINDLYGHKEGDNALIKTADILKRSLRSSDIIGRMGGDEFVGLALESSEYSEKKIINRITENLNRYNKQAKRQYKLSLSYGISFYNPEKPCSLEELLEQGDKEMYKEKRKKEKI